MSSKDGKGQKGRKRKAGEAGVMGSLPSTRPARIGGRREPAPAKARAATKGVAQKPAEPKAVVEERPSPKAAAGSPPGPKAAAGTPPEPKDTTSAQEGRPTPSAGPRPVRAAVRELDGAAPPSSARSCETPAARPQSGTELLTTVVQAAGELAQIGLTVGGQVLKRAVGRLPRP